MKQKSVFDKISPSFWLVLAIIGFVIIILTGRMTYYSTFDDYDIYNLLLFLGIGIVLMIPLFAYIIKKRNEGV